MSRLGSWPRMQGALYVNTIAAGILWGLLDGRKETIEGVISRFFGGKTPEVINRNLTAVGSGMEFGRELQRSGQVSLVLPPRGKARQDLHLTGTEAVALGAMAGGYIYENPTSL